MAQPVELRTSTPTPVPSHDPAEQAPVVQRHGSRLQHVLHDYFRLPSFLTGPRKPAVVATAVAPAAPAMPPPLKLGDKGERVTELQTLLKDAGYFAETPNGSFGVSTKRAVLDFQLEYTGRDGLQIGVDGVAGETTIETLRQLAQTRTQPLPEGTHRPERLAPGFYHVGHVQKLGPGSSGLEVQRAQEQLQKIGYNVQNTGVYDDATHAAVTDFQQRYFRKTGTQITVDGTIGQATGDAMQEAVELVRESPISWLESSKRVVMQAAPGLAQPVLKAGSTDKVQVAALQNQLIALGYGVTADGAYGPATTTAVTDFQRLYALLTGEPLTADGACGDATRRALSTAIDSGLMQRLPEPLRKGTIAKSYVRGVASTVVIRQLGDGDGGSLESRAALAYYAMHAMAARDGVVFSANESFRTYEDQSKLWNKYKVSEPGRAARPGWSTHQNGVAIDVSADAAGSQWLTKHAKEYGFILPGYTYTSGGKTYVETWHWEYRVDRLTNQARAFYDVQQLQEDPRPTALAPAQRTRRR